MAEMPGIRKMFTKLSYDDAFLNADSDVELTGARYKEYSAQKDRQRLAA
jgi:hypothetical protein